MVRDCISAFNVWPSSSVTSFVSSCHMYTFQSRSSYPILQSTGALVSVLKSACRLFSWWFVDSFFASYHVIPFHPQFCTIVVSILPSDPPQQISYRGFGLVYKILSTVSLSLCCSRVSSFFHLVYPNKLFTMIPRSPVTTRSCFNGVYIFLLMYSLLLSCTDTSEFLSMFLSISL